MKNIAQTQQPRENEPPAEYRYRNVDSKAH